MLHRTRAASVHDSCRALRIALSRDPRAPPARAGTRSFVRSANVAAPRGRAPASGAARQCAYRGCARSFPPCSPDFGEQLSAKHDVAAAAHERHQEIELLGSQGYLDAGAPHAPRARSNLDVAEADYLGRVGVRAPPRGIVRRSTASTRAWELQQAERLGQIVVAAPSKPRILSASSLRAVRIRTGVSIPPLACSARRVARRAWAA